MAVNTSTPGAARAFTSTSTPLLVGAADVGDVELRRHRRIRQIQLQVVPVDAEHRGVGRHAPARPRRLHAALDVPRVLLAVRLAARRRRRVEAARLEAARHRCRRRILSGCSRTTAENCGDTFEKILLRRHDRRPGAIAGEKNVFSVASLRLVVDARAGRQIDAARRP